MAIKPKDMVKVVDYTILDPTATVYDVKEVCERAREHDLVAVCVNPCFVPMAVELLENSSVKVATLIGYPLGGSTAKTKAFETKDALNNGAQEIEVVINPGLVKDKKWDLIKEDIKPVIDATKVSGVTKDIITKGVLETYYLDDKEIKAVTEVIKDVGLDFIKVGTDFRPSGGPDPEAVALIRKQVGRGIGVETYGGVEDFDDAIIMLDAGANRIGTSHAIEVVTAEDE